MEKLNNYGYRRIYIRKRGRMLEHRYIMEQILGRTLKPNEKIHHKNKIRHDNRPENLELFTNHAEHMHHRHPDNRKKLINWGSIKVPDKNYLHDKNTICLINGCNKLEHARNLCFKHFVSYRRFLKRKSFFK